jgi:hypothetical protein
LSQFRLVLATAVILVAGLPGVLRAEDAPAVAPLGSVRVGKLLYLGNSITLHGPLASIGWSGNWGMAASAAEKDYVNLVTSQLAEWSGQKPEAKVRNIADFERQFATYDIAAGLKSELEFGADLVVVAIGENVPALATEEAQTAYAAAFTRLLAEVRKSNPSVIVVRSCFWPDAQKDAAMKRACGDAGGVWVDISALSKDEAHYARSERKFADAGVAGHPGDRGMQAIAAAVTAAIKQWAAEKP